MTADLISGFGLYSMKLCRLHFLDFEGVIVLGRAPINPCLIGPLVLCLERGFRPPFEGLQPQLQCTTPAYRSADTFTSMLIQVSYQPIRWFWAVYAFQVEGKFTVQSSWHRRVKGATWGFRNIRIPCSECQHVRFPWSAHLDITQSI